LRGGENGCASSLGHLLTPAPPWVLVAFQGQDAGNFRGAKTTGITHHCLPCDLPTSFLPTFASNWQKYAFCTILTFHFIFLTISKIGCCTNFARWVRAHHSRHLFYPISSTSWDFPVYETLLGIVCSLSANLPVHPNIRTNRLSSVFGRVRLFAFGCWRSISQVLEPMRRINTPDNR